MDQHSEPYITVGRITLRLNFSRHGAPASHIIPEKFFHFNHVVSPRLLKSLKAPPSCRHYVVVRDHIGHSTNWIRNEQLTQFDVLNRMGLTWLTPVSARATDIFHDAIWFNMFGCHLEQSMFTILAISLPHLHLIQGCACLHGMWPTAKIMLLQCLCSTVAPPAPVCFEELTNLCMPPSPLSVEYFGVTKHLSFPRFQMHPH